MKFVYYFGDGQADGAVHQKDLLGGKGANLAEMTRLGIPVPPGFTITTEVCTHYMENGEFPSKLKKQLTESLLKIDTAMNQKFGSTSNPLLVSVRSGARQSMPGMMETVLNVGLTSKTLPGLIQQSGDERFVYDAYRRLITMYSDVVMEKAQGLTPTNGKGIREQLELILTNYKSTHNYSEDIDLTAEDLKKISELYKECVKDILGEVFPDDATTQLWGAITAVFKSWNGKRAVAYRRIENIPSNWGTAVNVQTMVFGNMGECSATGVAFTRNPATGENQFYGEWLANAQGEDVVAGIRTPNPLNQYSTTSESNNLPCLEKDNPKIYSVLDTVKTRLEVHYHDMQDLEFTIQKGRLWMLQTRTGKRNGAAAIRIAMDMLDEGLISENEALMRISPENIDEIMHDTVDPEAEKSALLLGTGLPAGPGGATGQIVFTAEDAEIWRQQGKQVILVRNETSPEDVHGMHVASGILTAKGGMTSHAALVARGWGKCCIVGCSSLNIDFHNKKLNIGNSILNEGDWVTLNGSLGNIYDGELSLKNPNLDQNKDFKKLMILADRKRKMEIRTNADSPEDAIQARKFGAEGIGLCRTEHMFFEPERISPMREMILAHDEKARRKAVMKLLPFQRDDFYGILKVMSPHPVTIRLLDPPLHEFLPHTEEQIEKLSNEMGILASEIKSRITALHESNPMLGHRGCRLGVMYPEITEMQSRAIFEATAQLVKEGQKPFPEVMIPLVGSAPELEHQKKVVNQLAKEVMQNENVNFKYLVGTMIELPRACVTADEIAEHAQFFSFGTNDLTQTTFGFSRDDVGSFMPQYLDSGIIKNDPFQSIDQEGVGELVKLGVQKGRSTNAKLKIGICGEHGGDPESITFFHKIGLNYVSCSPFRVPVSRLAAAQATIESKL
ncbi:MAG: pyruvate, phosphate dikinase [Candidatus Marinimicrobia bacterium]|nr:pyruvate, phosphate dikinase [Candidatus Neomarinimicrobiota bacterium]